MKQHLLVFFALAVLGGTARAENVSTLFPAFQGDTAATLPRGRFLVSATQLVLPIHRRFSTSGQREGLNTEFAKALSWREVIADDPSKSAQIGGLLDTYGIADTSLAGEYGGELRGRVDVTVPVIGYGITDRLGIYVALPIQHTRMQSRIGYRQTESAAALVKTLEREEQGATAHDLAKSLNDGFTDQLSRAGMRNNQDVDRTEIGDVRVEMPYVFPGPTLGTRRRASMAWFQSLVLPTGNAPDPRDLYPLSSGQGRFQLGTRGVLTVPVTPRFRWDTTAGVMVPLPGGREVRVPRNSNDSLSGELDEEARIQGGASYQLQLQGRWQFTRTIAVMAGGQHQRKFRESYRGSRYSQERYGWASQSGTERLESVFLNSEMNSLASFLAGDFPFPGQINLAVSLPVSGRNTLSGMNGVLQTSLFF